MSDSKKAKNLNDEEANTLILCWILLAVLLAVICSGVCIIPIRWSCQIRSSILYNYGIFLSTRVPIQLSLARLLLRTILRFASRSRARCRHVNEIISRGRRY